MLRSVPMVHLRVQVPGPDAPAVTRAIAREGALHLVDIGHGRVTTNVPPATLELNAAFRELTRRIRALLEKLEIVPQPISGALEEPELGDYDKLRDLIRLKLAPVEARVDDIIRRRAAATQRVAQAEQNIRFGALLREAEIDIPRIRAARFLSIRLGVATEENLTLLSSLLAPSAFAIVPLSAHAGETIVAAVITPASDSPRVASNLPLVEFESLPVEALGSEAAAPQGELQGAQSELAAIQVELEQERGQSAGMLRELLRQAEVGALLLEAQSHFAAAGKFIVISGWIPEDGAERMRRLLLNVTEGRAVVDIQKPEELHEVARGALKVPILHRNPIVLRPFQKLVDLYGAPSYTEVQPTAFFAVSFLLMFGLMFGDVGHGLVLFSAGYLLFHYFPRFLDYGILLMEGGAASAFFGVLYGSIFGFEHLLPAIWLRPLDDLSVFLTVALSFGVVLVSAGFILNVVNTWRTGNLFDALLGPRGLFGALVYWVLVAVLARAVIPGTRQLPYWTLLILLGIGVLLLILRRPITARLQRGRQGLPRSPALPGPVWLTALESAVDLVDTLFSYFANTVSFVRIAAFAAVHAGVFLAIFAIADTLAKLRFGGVFAVLAYVAGNAVVILLEGLTVSVQVLRLEYYEFFSKFFRGGGEPYKPLMLRVTAGPQKAGATVTPMKVRKR